MKMLHTIASLNPEAGGPIEAIRQLIDELQASEHSLEIACLDGADAPWLREFDVPVHALGSGSQAGYFYSKQYVDWLRANAKRFDCVVVRGIWRFNSFGTWSALSGSATPYYVFTHGMLDPWFKRVYPLKHLKKWLYWPWTEYRVLRDARAVLFTSEEERRLARESFWLYRCNEEVVCYGTAGPTVSREEAVAEFRKSLPELANDPFLLFLGRIHEKKGCELLLEAFADTVFEEQDYKLVIAGPDQVGLQAKLMALAKERGVAERVYWPGMLKGAQKWGALYAAEALVLPSHQENFGVVVAEALACSTPVLVSNKVNIYREIEASAAGFAAADSLAGTKALLNHWFSMSDAERTAMASKARDCFERHFTIQRAAESLLAVLERDGVGASSTISGA